ncbi:SusC/RagA family TonB-linked outer membrane protein [Hymenobacter coccineus]|uniref:SusC/RagA family TonB-linked outer membrane protein n=1 Tax=Hymenobacter coccineus TaxID=1908235 RepID=A0A1G1TLN1_9BACT|nr:SusC/RagA family TonB-linked outer membrane protein [Hymenobacter coccineus]
MKTPLPPPRWLVLAGFLSGPLLTAPIPSLAAGLQQAADPIKGRVVDEKGVALPGVNVVVKGSNTGTQTDAEGRFSLKAATDATLVFSFVGSKAQEVAVGGRSTIDITLLPDTKQLADVVVVGYGTQRKADLTSSVASVKEESFVKGATQDAGQLIQGKVAGLTVVTPSGDPTGTSQIVLRGTATLNADTQPLVLIDGIPGDLKTVAPEDIQSVDVLKDGSAAAIYGTRGTNGVILITTRRPQGNVTPTIEYSGYASTQRIARRPEVLTADEYRQKIADGVGFTDQKSSNDWLKVISQNPLTHVHNLTFRGGNAQTNYLVSGNYRALEGILQKSDNRTFTGRADINHNMFDGRVKLNLGILNSDNKYTSTSDGNSFNGYTYRQALIRNPTAPIYNADGTYAQEFSLFNYENPLSRLYDSDGLNTSQNTRLSGSIVWEPINDLQFKALGSNTRYDQTRGYSENKQHPSTLRDGLNGYASRGTTEVIDKLLELTANYSHSIGEHRFSALAGYSYQDDLATNFYMRNFDFPTDVFTYNNIGTGNALKIGRATEYSDKTSYNLIGFFGRLTYNYKEKYLLLASVRREASSRFLGANQPWGTFPAVSLGWRINKENFLASAGFLDDLKLRVGYGVTGTAPGSSFLGVSRLGYGGYFLANGRWVQSLAPISNPNPSLKWEEKHEFNAGVDYSFFKGRVYGTVDYYIRRTLGLLYDYQVPSPPNLFPTTTANVGSLENRGLEVQLNVVPVQTKDFTWTSTFNFSTNKNTLLSLNNDLYQLTNDFFNTGYTGEPIQTYTSRVQVGQKLGNFYGYKVVDVTSDGKWVYMNKEGQSVPYDQFTHSEDDKQVLGNGLPKYYGGWNNSFRYKHFDLGITMRGAFGFQILNVQRMYYENTGVTQYNRLRSAYDPIFGKAVLNNTMPLEFNSYYVENGDYWKVDNITFGYNFQPNIVKYVKNLRVYVSTLNTATITKYKGLDPEVNRLGLSPGIDERDKYPTVRTFTAGLNVTF